VGMLRDLVGSWPVLRQVLTGDRLGLGQAAQSRTSRELSPRTDDADRVVESICPYCAVGCAQRSYVADEEVIQVEGDPRSPISRGRLCARGSATKDLVAGPGREMKVRYRRPGGTEWEDLRLDTAMEMIADRVIESRERGWQHGNDEGKRLNRTMAFGTLGGAALDNEENYLIKKLYTALGAIQIENQARI
jgi:formate dehydrogenase major subunit